MRVVVYNLGCKVNQYECDGLINSLKTKGHSVSDKLSEADLYILNTCAVTSEAERKSRQCVARCRKFNPEATVVVCGCASQNNASQFSEKDGVCYVSGVANKADIVEHLADNGVFVAELPRVYEDNLMPESLRTRSYVKVQDGCDNFCAYCLIPYLRGRSRSRNIESIVTECENVSRVSSEIVLTGINLSDYGKNIQSSLAQLIENLAKIHCRIRLGSLEVGVVDERLLRALSGLKDFCEQFHLSLQSGSNAVLRAMNRHYTTEEYLEKVDLIRKFFPSAGITTDLICGFPTESEENFAETLDFIGKVNFSDMHIFPYSTREGTTAGKLKTLPSETLKQRVAMAEKTAESMRNSFLKGLLNVEQEVLFEDVESDKIVGRTGNYVKVYADKNCFEKGEVARVLPLEIYGQGLLAKRS